MGSASSTTFLVSTPVRRHAAKGGTRPCRDAIIRVPFEGMPLHRASVGIRQAPHLTRSIGSPTPLAETHQWRELKGTGPAPSGRHFPAVTVVRRNLIVFGGFDGSDWCNDVHVLNLGEAVEAKPTASAGGGVDAAWPATDGLASALPRRPTSLPRTFPSTSPQRRLSGRDRTWAAPSPPREPLRRP